MRIQLSVCLLLSLGIVFPASGTVLFTYEGDVNEVWCDIPLNQCCEFPEDSRMQSPIDFSTRRNAVVPSCALALNQLWFSGAYFNTLEGVFFNTGNTAEFEPSEDIAFPPQITGGPLGTDTYQLLQFHFHWGADDDRGSEHTIDGEAYALEMHAVHYNLKYPSVAVAVTKPDGLAVLGIFFDENGDSESKFVTDLIETYAGDIENQGEEVEVEINLGQAFLENFDMTEYYTYQGSLTTPLCFESVTWIVFPTPINLDGQLDDLRTLVRADGSSLNDNFRPTQPLNGRVPEFPRRDD